MKKIPIQALKLHRETVALLAGHRLFEVDGGIGPNLPPSKIKVSGCVSQCCTR